MKFLSIIAMVICFTFLSCHRKKEYTSQVTISCAATETTSCKTQAPSRQSLIKTTTDKKK